MTFLRQKRMISSLLCYLERNIFLFKTLITSHTKRHYFFMQEVWKKSHQFGIGTAKSKKYGFILVARYSPRGNGGGPMVFKDNVFPPGALSSYAFFL